MQSSRGQRAQNFYRSVQSLAAELERDFITMRTREALQIKKENGVRARQTKIDARRRGGARCPGTHGGQDGLRHCPRPPARVGERGPGSATFGVAARTASRPGLVVGLGESVLRGPVEANAEELDAAGSPAHLRVGPPPQHPYPTTTPPHLSCGAT